MIPFAIKRVAEFESMLVDIFSHDTSKEAIVRIFQCMIIEKMEMMSFD